MSMDHEEFRASTETNPASIDDVVAIDNEAVKRAFQSILRNNQLPQLHRDHASHSNQAEIT